MIDINPGCLQFRSPDTSRCIERDVAIRNEVRRPPAHGNIATDVASCREARRRPERRTDSRAPRAAGGSGTAHCEVRP